MLLSSCFWKALLSLNIPRLFIFPGPSLVHTSQSSGGVTILPSYWQIYLPELRGPGQATAGLAQSSSLEQALSGPVSETQSRGLKGTQRFMEYFRPQDHINYISKAWLSEARELAITSSSVGSDFLIDFISPTPFLCTMGSLCCQCPCSLCPLPSPIFQAAKWWSENIADLQAKGLSMPTVQAA